MTAGVTIQPLTVHADDRGYLMEILRDDDALFKRFGQVYLTVCYPGLVKAWHLHERQTDNLACVAGTMKLGIFDDRPASPTRGQSLSVILGLVHPVLVQIPPGLWHGFTPIGGEPATLLNVPTLHYDAAAPDEQRRDPFVPELPFEWFTRGG